MYHEECRNAAFCTAIALQSMKLFQSLLQSHCIFFRPPTSARIYIYLRFHSRSISNDMGLFFSAVAMGLNIPPGYTVRPTHGNETGQPLLHLPPCALHAIRMARMWRMKH